jgi:transaldolase
MKLFLNTADRRLIEKFLPTGLIDGVTTNPTHLSKEGSNLREVLIDICKMVPDGEVSIEVVAKEPEAVYQEALEISELAENTVVKIPFVQEYLSIIDRLTDEDIDLNITLVFNVLQALMVANLSVLYISPFVGRLDDIGVPGMELVGDILEVIENYELDSEVLVASIRSVDHWKAAAIAGADVATIPPAIFEQAMKHPLTDIGIAKFDADWKKMGKSRLLG